ncbi:hypothetical protein ACIQFU_11440 [Streptomyces sp. NPDC093065]|uniref:hypothetical protein n=1 Tax=Streptomyces sp. NPDC093065 TaxID=3366021 RepID=UPI00380B7B0C
MDRVQQLGREPGHRVGAARRAVHVEVGADHDGRAARLGEPGAVGAVHVLDDGRSRVLGGSLTADDDADARRGEVVEQPAVLRRGQVVFADEQVEAGAHDLVEAVAAGAVVDDALHRQLSPAGVGAPGGQAVDQVREAHGLGCGGPRAAAWDGSRPGLVTARNVHCSVPPARWLHGVTKAGGPVPGSRGTFNEALRPLQARGPVTVKMDHAVEAADPVAFVHADWRLPAAIAAISRTCCSARCTPVFSIRSGHEAQHQPPGR